MTDMLSSRLQMARQRRPRERYYSVDDAWRADIKALLEKRGISQAELARRIGCSPGAITLIFKPATVQSRLVRLIHKVLELQPPPEAATISERNDGKRRLDRIWDAIAPEDRDALLMVAERFQQKRQ